MLVRFGPGARWPGDDVHEPGPEDTFLHCAAGTRHSPSTPTGGDLFVYYPEG